MIRRGRYITKRQRQPQASPFFTGIQHLLNPGLRAEFARAYDPHQNPLKKVKRCSCGVRRPRRGSTAAWVDHVWNCRHKELKRKAEVVFGYFDYAPHPVRLES